MASKLGTRNQIPGFATSANSGIMLILLVPRTGLEPVQYYYRGILSPNFRSITLVG